MPNFVPISNLTSEAPYSFENAPKVRHKAWSAGFDPAYWYPVEHDGAIARGDVVEVKFWDMSVALFRGTDGRLSAVENRCAHRQVKLSLGEVEGCQLKCSYHGWTYDCDGKLTKVGHELFGGRLPAVKLRTYPVQVKYGLIWVFFGDRSLMAERPIPTIPELEGEARWIHTALDFDVRCHPTALINNVMDSTHVASLHRTFRTRSLVYGKVTGCESDPNSVRVRHDIELDKGGLLRWIVKPLQTSTQEAVYDYPYLRVSVGGVYKLWNFMLPTGPRRTRLFIFACADRVKIPFTPWVAPDLLVNPVLGIAKQMLVRPLFVEDVWSAEAEQQGYDTHHDAPAVDPHPAIHPSYQLTVRKWEEHLERAGQAPTEGRGSVIKLQQGG